MEYNHIPAIIDIVDNIVFEDRKRKYSNSLITRIPVILQIYGISYRSAERFLRNHSGLAEALGIHEIPNFRTLSRRARIIDWHYINALILDLISTERENSAIGSLIVKTCKQSTASRRRIYGNYKDQQSSWGFSTKGWSTGGRLAYPWI